jgi:hypothetical protein
MHTFKPHLTHNIMSHFEPRVVMTWTLTRMSQIQAHSSVVEILKPSRQLRILIFPNTAHSEMYLTEWCQRQFGRCVCMGRFSPTFPVPFQYLPHPLRVPERIIPVHAYTPYPDQPFDNSVLLQVAALPCQHHHSHQVVHRLFSLSYCNSSRCTYLVTCVVQGK